MSTQWQIHLKKIYVYRRTFGVFLSVSEITSFILFVCVIQVTPELCDTLYKMFEEPEMEIANDRKQIYTLGFGIETIMSVLLLIEFLQ